MASVGTQPVRAPALSSGSATTEARRRTNWVPYVLLLPGIAWLFVFFVVPMWYLEEDDEPGHSRRQQQVRDRTFTAVEQLAHPPIRRWNCFV